jgi:hypothetical protein
MTNYHVIEDAYEGGYDIKVILYEEQNIPRTSSD